MKVFALLIFFIQWQYTLTAINYAIVINKNSSRISKFFVLQVAFFSLKVLSSSNDPITLLHITAELYIVVAKYFLFSQKHVEGL